MCSWHQSDVGSANIQDMASLQGKRLLPVNQEKMLIWNWIKCTSHYRQRERERGQQREIQKHFFGRDATPFPFFFICEPYAYVTWPANIR